MTIKVLLADDEELVRFGPRTVLEAAGDFTVVGEAASGLAAVHAAQELRPDVVLMDIRMPVKDGLAATREILALPHRPQVAVLTAFPADEYVYAALAAGAAGFLLEDTPPREIAAAVRSVADGTATLSPKVTAALIDAYVDRRAAPRKAEATRRLADLSDREREVLALSAAVGPTPSWPSGSTSARRRGRFTSLGPARWASRPARSPAPRPPPAARRRRAERSPPRARPPRAASPAPPGRTPGRSTPTRSPSATRSPPSGSDRPAVRAYPPGMPDDGIGRGAELTELPARPGLPEELGQVMGRIARTLQEEHGDVQRTLQSITTAAVSAVPGAEYASVSLVAGRRVDSRGATAELVREVDELQARLGEGPCLDSLRDQQTVSVRNFATEDRWPRFAGEAARRGMGSLLSFQLFTDDDTLGALNLYATRPHSFDAEDETVGLIFASHAAIALSAARQEENLRQAIDKRDLIGQAKGILMERYRLTAPQAFELLVLASSHTNRKLFDIADELTSTGSMPAG